jgi:hypothetical protein
MTKMHLDIWTPNCTAFDVYLINTVPATVEEKVTLTPTLSGWNSFDINMSLFDTINRAAVTQIKFVGVPFGTAHVFYDNFYFWKPAGTVPVTLVNFDAKKSGTQSIISWTTTNEINNQLFRVERSNNGIDWKAIETVMPKVPVSGFSNYQMTDRMPMAGINYYRLQQADLDGTLHYSSIKTLNFSKKETVQVLTYPNPTLNKVKVTLNTASASSVSIQIFDATGKLVKKLNYNNASLLQQSWIDITALQSGVYNMTIQQGADTYHTNIIKQ